MTGGCSAQLLLPVFQEQRSDRVREVAPVFHSEVGEEGVHELGDYHPAPHGPATPVAVLAPEAPWPRTITVLSTGCKGRLRPLNGVHGGATASGNDFAAGPKLGSGTFTVGCPTATGSVTYSLVLAGDATAGAGSTVTLFNDN